MAVSVSDQSATSAQSGGTFDSHFGSIGLPKNNEIQVIAVAVVAILGLIIWKKL